MTYHSIFQALLFTALSIAAASAVAATTNYNARRIAPKRLRYCAGVSET